MVIEDIGDGYVRITNPGGKVMDRRTRRKYRKAEVREHDAQFFEEA